MLGRRKKTGNGTGEKYRNILGDRKVPILTLDNKWYKLFSQIGSTTEIESLTRRLNELLRRQGKVNTELNDIRLLKKKLMNDIVESMDMLDKEPEIEDKMGENRRLIEECNEKMESYRREGQTLPDEIEEVNRKLTISTMDLCYKKLRQNTEEINEIGSWIEKTRIELKKKIIRKQEAETANQSLYSYMHDIFGAEILEIFDREYNTKMEKPDKKKGKK